MKTVNPSTQFGFTHYKPLRINGERRRTIKFFTLGCKVNQYDTQSIRQRFIQAGFKELTNGLPADIYLVNTCTVTENADRKSYRLIKSIRKENSSAKIIVTGCLAENDANALKDTGGIDFIISKRFFPEGVESFNNRTRAFLKIQDGCNNFCSYCKVPYVRGRSRSRPLPEIVNEAKRLTKCGFKEIVLCGICLGAYGNDLIPQSSLIEIIKELENINGLLRIRLSSIEPHDVSDALIGMMAASKKLCHHLHIPLQSGDNRILRMMNRNYSSHDYSELIKKIKRIVPGVAITTDVLVGFPGEGEENFRNTTRLIKQIKPLKVHIFPYSERKVTVAARNFRDVIPKEVIRQRILHLEGISQRCSFAYKKHFLNQDMDVLIESSTKENIVFWEGYTANYIKVKVKSERNLHNCYIPLKLKRLVGNHIVANINS